MVTFKNARLVGKPADKLYNVVITDGFVKGISDVSDGAYTNGVSNGVSDTVDLGGKSYIGPSLVDHHIHSKLWARATKRLDLSAAQSAAEVLEIVRKGILNDKTPPGPGVDRFFVGQHLRVAAWSDLGDLNRTNLDKISGDRPVVLYFNGFHSLCCNSLALKSVDIDPDGHLGILKETEAFILNNALASIPEEILDSWIHDMCQKITSRGVTEVIDLEIDDNIKDWTRRIKEKGNNSLRVQVGLYDSHLPYAISQGLKTGDPLPGSDGLITIGPYKIITDGSLGSQTAYCHDPYPGTDDYGIWVYPRKTLAEMCMFGTENGFRLAVHAIGDHANQLTLKTIESLPKPLLPDSTIEHAQLLSFEDIQLFKRLGLIASVQPTHMIDDKELCEKFWPGREHRAWPFRSLYEAGVKLWLGSDAPVAPLDPWDALAVAISRTGIKDEDGASGWHTEQNIPIEEAWKGSTSNGKVSIDVGDRADIAVFASNPLTASPKELRNMGVRATLLGGRFTHNTFSS